MREPLRALLAAALLGSVFAGLLPAAPAVALPPPGSGVPVWATDWMKDGAGNPDYDPGRATALRQAREFDLILAHATTYDDHVADMMAANPNLRIFAYVQGMFSPDGSFPRGWYARNRSGRKIRSRDFGTFLMNPRSAGWQRAVLARCQERRAASHYHGCFLDSLGPTGVNLASVTALPINPSTDKAYTRRAWLGATKGVAQKVEAAVAPRPVLANGLVDGPGYANAKGRTERLLDGCTGGMAEAFMRPATWKATQHRDEAAWRQDVDMLVDAANRSEGSIAFVVTKVWTSATSGQIAAWHRYALASFLLGYKPGHAYFSFRSGRELTTPSPWWDAEIGVPTGGYFREGGLYVRNFTNGKVVVNPSTSKRSLSLDGRYVDLGGVTRYGNFALTSHAASILTEV